MFCTFIIVINVTADPNLILPERENSAADVPRPLCCRPQCLHSFVIRHIFKTDAVHFQYHIPGLNATVLSHSSPAVTINILTKRPALKVVQMTHHVCFQFSAKYIIHKNTSQLLTLFIMKAQIPRAILLRVLSLHNKSNSDSVNPSQCL